MTSCLPGSGTGRSVSLRPASWSTTIAFIRENLFRMDRTRIALALDDFKCIIIRIIMHASIRAMLDELRTFVLLAEEGSIQRVAERLPLTQPAVTRQIQRLESVLNLELLDRRQKPPRLTPAGVEVLSRSRDILAAYADLLALGKRTEPDGLLRIGVANGLADDRFATVISDIRRRFPRVSLRLMTGWSQDLSEKLRRGFIDAAVLLAGE